MEFDKKDSFYFLEIKFPYRVNEIPQENKEFINHTKAIYPGIIGGPKPDYDSFSSQSTKNSMFFYSRSKADLGDFAHEIIARRFANSATHRKLNLSLVSNGKFLESILENSLGAIPDSIEN